MPPIDDKGLSPLDQVQVKINEHKVMMFSKSYCPYCIKVSRFVATAIQLFSQS